MKKKLKSTLLIILMAIAALFVLVGCSLGDSLKDIVQNNELEAQVTYYVNNANAKFTPNTAKVKYMYYKAGAKVLNIGNTGNIGVECEGYEFSGWYHIKEDENNELKIIPGSDYTDPTDNSTHHVYELGEEVDFTKPIEKGEHWHVAAKWSTRSKVQVKLVIENAPNAEIDIDTASVTASSPLYGKQAVKQGDVVKVSSYESNGLLGSISGDPIPQKDGGFTFVNYYADEACTQLVAWPLVKQDEDVTIYAKYMVGDWNLVSTPADVKAMFDGLGSAANHYWLLNDIDCGPSNISITPKNRVLAEIQGNGFTISNLKVEARASANTKYMSMFKNIAASAKIENLSFNGLQLVFTMRNTPLEIYFAFETMEAGATINNVSLEGTLTVVKDASVNILNMMSGTDKYAHCLYGGYANDAAYREASGGNGFKIVGEDDPSKFINTGDNEN